MADRIGCKVCYFSICLISEQQEAKEKAEHTSKTGHDSWKVLPNEYGET